MQKTKIKLQENLVTVSSDNVILSQLEYKIRFSFKIIRPRDSSYRRRGVRVLDPMFVRA